MSYNPRRIQGVADTDFDPQLTSTNYINLTSHSREFFFSLVRLRRVILPAHILAGFITWFFTTILNKLWPSVISWRWMLVFIIGPFWGSHSRGSRSSYSQCNFYLWKQISNWFRAAYVNSSMFLFETTNTSSFQSKDVFI